MDELQAIRDQFEKDKTLLSTEDLRIKYLGRNGLVNAAFKKLNEVAVEERKEYGQKVNELKIELSQKTDEQLQKERLTLDGAESIDTSLPGIKPRLGHLHPTTETIRKINSFFHYYGYSIYEGPEIETNDYNFEKLNLPEHHPARDLQDTLYIHEPELLLRTHTSSVETRAMTNETLPIRIVVPGKAFRNETENMTNNSMFFQYEGLVIDKNITMTDLKGTLKAFVTFLYGKNIKTRFRCKYYPQVEPGAGLDIECTFCHGKKCHVCKYRGFIEVLGSGMVHPNALKKCGINPAVWSGFAFGMGLDRLVMTTYGIDDIRKLYNGEVVFN